MLVGVEGPVGLPGPLIPYNHPNSIIKARLGDRAHLRDALNIAASEDAVKDPWVVDRAKLSQLRDERDPEKEHIYFVLNQAVPLACWSN